MPQVEFCYIVHYVHYHPVNLVQSQLYKALPFGSFQERTLFQGFALLRNFYSIHCHNISIEMSLLWYYLLYSFVIVL